MQTRRLIAAVVIVIVVVLLALLIKGCDNSATNTALKNFNANVYKLINQSDSNGSQVFYKLTHDDLSTLDLGPQVQNANDNVTTAEHLSTPSQMSAAQSKLVQAMQYRAQGIQRIANWAPKAANKDSSKDAVYQISVGTSELYGSDVIYKTSVATEIAKALNAAGIPVGTSGSEPNQINPGQIVPDMGWLQSTWITDAIGAQQSTKQANANNDQPGLTHGDQLNYVTVANTQLTAGGTYTIPGSQAQTWTLNVTNGGQTVENDVGCSVTINDVSITGTSSIPSIASGATEDCTVHLLSKPSGGPYSVTAKVDAVPGEKNLQNNVATYTITFN